MRMEVILKSIIEKISERYGISELELESVMKEVPLPYVGEKVEGKCKNVKYNYGLYSQCLEWSEEEYCMKCKCEGKYGNIEDRKEVKEYVDPYGNKERGYVEVLNLLNIPIKKGEEACKKAGINIKLNEIKKKRGRPKKEKTNTIVSDSDDEEKIKKKRGRPKKEKSEIVMNKEERQENEVTEVTILNLNGKKYLRTENDELYDNESHELIGLFNSITNEITKLN